jgi:hypothetical protein
VDTKEVILSEFMMYLSVKLGTKSGTANSALAGVKTPPDINGGPTNKLF